MALITITATLTATTTTTASGIVYWQVHDPDSITGNSQYFKLVPPAGEVWLVKTIVCTDSASGLNALGRVYLASGDDTDLMSVVILPAEATVLRNQFIYITSTQYLIVFTGTSPATSTLSIQGIKL